MKTAIEYLLFKSGISNYQISKDTGLSAVLLSKYATGKSDVGRMTLDNAIILFNHFNEVVKKMEKEFGSVKFEGKEYILKEDAYLDHTQGLNGIADNHYAAVAIDADGYEYTVYWNPVDGWEQLEDASDHCEWDLPVSVEEI